MAFIDLTNVEIVDEVSSDAKVLIVEDDEIKRTAIPDLSKVEVAEEVSEDAKMLVVENGEIKRATIIKSNSAPSIAGFDVVIVHDPDSNEATLAHGDYTTLREKYTKKLPILGIINNYNVNSEINFDYPNGISFATSDYIGVYNSSVDIEYQIYPDNHIVAWDIG